MMSGGICGNRPHGPADFRMAEQNRDQQGGDHGANFVFQNEHKQKAPFPEPLFVLVFIWWS